MNASPVPGGSTQQPQPNEQNLRLDVTGHKENCHVTIYDENTKLLGSVTASRASEILKPEIARLVEEKAKGRY